MHATMPDLLLFLKQDLSMYGLTWNSQSPVCLGFPNSGYGSVPSHEGIFFNFMYISVLPVAYMCTTYVPDICRSQKALSPRELELWAVERQHVEDAGS